MYAELYRVYSRYRNTDKKLYDNKLCSADYNAYTEDVNPKPDGFKDNLRSAGKIMPVNIEIC